MKSPEPGGSPEREGRQVAVDPEDTELARFHDEGPGGPLVMLNLLRFGDGGYAACQEYAQQLRDTIGRMVADPGYLEVARLCAQALTATALQATTPWR